MSKETMYPKSSFMLMYSRQTGASSNPSKRIFFGLLVQSWLDDSTEGKTLLSLETRIFVSNFFSQACSESLFSLILDFKQFQR